MKLGIENKNRIAGVDVMKVILSVNVIVIHLLYYGGPRTQLSAENPAYYLLWTWGLFIDCTVNCFAILSGFLAYGKDVKWAGLLRLYLTVLFHSLAVTALVALFIPQARTMDNFWLALFPLTNNSFWYFTGYCGVFLLMPLLIQGMKALTKKQADLLVLGLMLAFSLLPTLTASDPFVLQRGYSALWLGAMFILGLYLKKYYGDLGQKRLRMVLIYLGSVVLTGVGFLVSFVEPKLGTQMLIEYNSPTIVLGAVAAVLFFASLPCPPAAQKAAAYLSPFAFSIYIVHEHPLVRDYIVTDCLLPVLGKSPVLQVLAVFVTALGIWCCGFMLEWIRRQLFKIPALIFKKPEKIDQSYKK